MSGAILMKKVVFQTHKPPSEHIIEEIEYDDEAIDEEISRDFVEWLCMQHNSGWYIEGEE